MKERTETKRGRVTRFYQDMFLFTAANGRSHESPQVRTDINRSHLLHKAHPAGDSPKGGGDREDTYCTLSSNTCFYPPDRKKNRTLGKRAGLYRLISKYKRKHVQFVSPPGTVFPYLQAGGPTFFYWGGGVATHAQRQEPDIQRPQQDQTPRVGVAPETRRG